MKWCYIFIICIILVLDKVTGSLDCTSADVKVYNSPKTYLATYPRSGNSYTRWMVESLSDIQTSSIYCDPDLEVKLKGECDTEITYLIKTHFPHVKQIKPRGCQRALVLVRNPFDTFLSYFHFAHPGLNAKAKNNKYGNHSGGGGDRKEPGPRQLFLFAESQVT